jgi:hypothetical protein
MSFTRSVVLSLRATRRLVLELNLLNGDIQKKIIERCKNNSYRRNILFSFPSDQN